MPKKPFVDFRDIRSRITMEQVLEHYGVLHTFKRAGDRLSGPCPIRKGSNPTQFRVETQKNLRHCFSGCKCGGNTLDSSRPPAQEQSICHRVTATSRPIVMLDEDDAGNAGQDEIACRLARYCFVKVHQFAETDTQPEHLSAEPLQRIVEGRP